LEFGILYLLPGPNSKKYILPCDFQIRRQKELPMSKNHIELQNKAVKFCSFEVMKFLKTTVWDL